MKMINLPGMQEFDNKSITTAYANYVQRCFNLSCTDDFNLDIDSELNSYSALSYDEFREYYFLNLMGKNNEFLDNIAREYQNIVDKGGELSSSV